MIAHLDSDEYKKILALRLRVINKLFRENKLNVLEHEIGYGGLIQHFKNYIIRRDNKYLIMFQQQLIITRQIISTLSESPGIKKQNKGHSP